MIRALVRASHPEPCAAVTLGATLLAVAAGHGTARALLVGVTVLAGQLSIGWSNDWFDASRDRRAGRRDKPVASGALPVRVVAAGAVLAAAAAVPLSLLFGPFAASLHLTGVAAGWLYNWPLKTTVASPLPYAVGFGLLPGFVVAALPGQPAPPGWLLAAGALLGTGAHFANALPDFQHDALTGIRGLPQRVGAVASQIAAVVLLVAAGAVLVVARPSPAGFVVLAVSGLALVTAVMTRQRYGDRLLFRAVLLVALADVALLLTAPL